MTKQELIQKYNELEAEQNKIIGKIELLDEQAKEESKTKKDGK